MSQRDFHLAQINIARTRFDIDDPRFEPFIDLLAPVNAVAERMPGFVWRLTDETGDGAVGVPGFDDPRIIINMSVWTDEEALFAFAYKTAHTKVMSRRAEWFEPLARTHLALWWIPAGHIPDVAEGRARLERIDRDGPTPSAFGFADLHDPHGAPIGPGLPQAERV
jgi:hypothetical protein